ncbi:class IV adenylate cyclase [Treponema sp. J25]|jgi:adenylate cyclase class 2|uniref:class IV adenylate cyclase n=1 Tax=Treponema sp. J25 TaxID=2094121 RepID=UPI0010482AE7|nr:class IV adenylate cyclase [Treponema sp. J25]TCW60653.1 class IV adenylate cyclase [Treponema sp. J25]
MATEVEVKAWVKDVEKTRKNIEGFASYLRNFEKEDSYWLPANVVEETSSTTERPRHPMLGSGIRIRRDGSVCYVTFKQKEVRQGTEVNQEVEFSVSDQQAFERLLEALGFTVWIRKHKQGQAWQWDHITIELCQIKGLGTFVELEILLEDEKNLPSHQDHSIQEAQEALYNCLEKIGIPRDQIENRYYTEMLLEKIKNSQKT